MRLRRVLVVGSHLGYVHQMDAGIIGGFRSIGCEVEAFDYRASALAPAWLKRLIPHNLRHRLSPRRFAGVDRVEKQASSRQFDSHVAAFRPELVFALQAERLAPESVQAARRLRAVTINWIGDEPWRYTPPEIVPAYDLWAVIDPTWQEWLAEHGAKRTEHLPVACDPRAHQPVELSEADQRRWASRLCFIGGYSEDRERTLAPVADLGLAIWGPGWDNARIPEIRSCVRESRLLTEKEWKRAYAAADVVLNIHAQGEECLNMRVFEALGMGVCLLSDYRRDIDRVLNGVVASFRTAQEMRQQAQQLLADPARRRELAVSGRGEAIARHTFTHRASQVIEWAESLASAVKR